MMQLKGHRGTGLTGSYLTRIRRIVHRAGDEEEESDFYTLTFNIEFPHDNDTIFFAHSYPYTYSDLQDYLMDIQKHPVKSKFCKLRLLCRSLAGNNVYSLTVTGAQTEEELKRVILCSLSLPRTLSLSLL